MCTQVAAAVATTAAHADPDHRRVSPRGGAVLPLRPSAAVALRRAYPSRTIPRNASTTGGSCAHTTLLHSGFDLYASIQHAPDAGTRERASTQKHA